MATLKDNLVMGPSRVIGDAFFGGVVMPTITETQDIGSSTMKWRYIYAKEIMGNIDPDKVLGDGLVAIKSGGTNSGSQTSNRVNWFNGTGIVSAANIWTNGSKLTVNGTAAPSGSTKFEVLGNTRISSSQSGAGGDISLELWRGTYASWKFLNDSGTLKLQNNYTTAAGSYFDVLAAAHNTGHITVTRGSVYPLDGNTTQSLGKDDARWDIYAINVDSGTIYVEGAAQFDGPIMAQSTLRVTGASTFIGAATFNNNTTTTGVATFNGNVQMNSSVSADSLTAGSLLVNGNTSLVNNTSSGHILPHATGTYDIGSSALKYREIYAGAMYATQFYGNATTATGWKSNLSLTIGNKTIAFNGDEGSVSYTFADMGVSDSGHTHTKIVTEGDNRSVATVPNDYNDSAIKFRGIKTNATIGSPSGSTYAYLVGLRGWSGNTGGNAHELAFHNNGISWRHGATTSWGDWYDLVYTTNKTAVGSVKHPVYVDAYGQVKACNDAAATSTQYLEAVSAAGAIGAYSDGSNTVGIYLINKAGTSYYPLRFTSTGSSIPDMNAYTNIMFRDGKEPYLYSSSGSYTSARIWFSTTAYTEAAPTRTGTDTQTIIKAGNRGFIAYQAPYQEVTYTNGTAGATTVAGSNRFRFAQYSYNATTSARLSYYDYFYLPTTAAGKTTNNSYTILTSRDDVTVGQGGTGRSSWDAGRFIYSSATTTLENTSEITTDGTDINLIGITPQITFNGTSQNGAVQQAFIDYNSVPAQQDAANYGMTILIGTRLYLQADKTNTNKASAGIFISLPDASDSITNANYTSFPQFKYDTLFYQETTKDNNTYIAPILHAKNALKYIFTNCNLTRSTLSVIAPDVSRMDVVPSGAVDLFSFSAKDTGLSTDTGNWRMWLASPSSGSTTLNMWIDGTFQASSIRSDRVDGGLWITGTHQTAFQVYAATSAGAGGYYQGWYMGKTPSGAWSWGVLSGYNDCYFCYGTDANYAAGTNTTANIKFGYDGKVYNAVWNDYAEYRMSAETEPGRATAPNEKGIRQRTTQRLQIGVRIVSDTYGMAIGETDKAKTPMGLVGRVLAYPYKDITEYHVGDCVCSAPNGTVDIMTREEIRERPECIIGTVDEIPDYDIWDGTLSLATNGKTNHKIPVKGRIWIDIK